MRIAAPPSSPASGPRFSRPGVRDSGLHGRLQGRPAAALCGGRIFPEAANSPRRTSSTRPTRPASSSTSTASSTSRRSTRAGSRSSSCRDLYGDEAVSAGPDGKRSYEDGRHGRRPRHPGRSRSPTTTSRTRARRRCSSRCRSTATSAAASRAACAPPRTSRWRPRTAARSWTASRTTSPPPAASPRSTSTRSRTCSPRRPSTSSTSTSTAGRSATWWNQPLPSTYTRGNTLGTDLNRQMPTIGRINPTRNPLQESEMSYGTSSCTRWRAAGRAARWPTAPTSTASSTRRPTWTSCTRPASSTRSTTAA